MKMMIWKLTICFCASMMLLFISGCKNEQNDILEIGCSAEKIYWKNDSVYWESVAVDTVFDEDTKCYLVSTIKYTFPNARFEFFSSEDNLLMALGMCSEVGYPVGYKFSYDSLGRTERVSWVEVGGGNSINEYDGEYLLKEMIRLYCNNDSSWSKYDIIRDSLGNVIKIGELDDCYDYDLSYGVYDGEYFWESDLDGGDIHFIVAKKKKDRSIKCGTAIDVYYMDGRLAVEAAYWNDHLIKCLTHKRNGCVGCIYDYEMTPLEICLRGCLDNCFTDDYWFCKN